MKRHTLDKKDRAATLLAGGFTIKAAAKECGIGERTLHGWLADDEAFGRLVARYRSRLVDRTLGRLAAVAAKAVKTLDSCLSEETADPVRVRAAAVVLEQLVRHREHAELAAEVAEIKQRLEGQS